MSIYRCNRCPYSTASHWLLREHELKKHVQDIKIDPNNPKAPTTVSFGPDAANHNPSPSLIRLDFIYDY